MIKKLKRKFVFVNMILVSIVLVITFSVACVITYNRICRESYAVMESRIMRDVPDIQEGFKRPKEEKKRPFEMADAKEEATFLVRLEDGENVKEVIGGNLVIEQEVLQNIVTSCLSQGKDRGTIKDMGLRYLKYTDGAGIQIVFMDRSDEISTMRNLVLVFLLVGIGSMGIFLIISICLAGWVVGPVKDSWDRERQFVADASHELKTPLTVILANTGILLNHKEETIEAEKKWLENTKEEAVRMKELVGNLLELARADAGTDSLVFSRVNLSEAAWSVALPFEPVMFEQKKSLHMNVDPDICVLGDGGKLKQLFAILLDNGCKYSQDNGSVTLTLTASRSHAQISVHNTGSYIDKEKAPHVFERFYRGDEARTREKGGYGLGLAIAKTIVDAHRGRISLQSTKEEGTTFFVTIPLVKP